MANTHKNQHFVPSSYLAAWCDSNTPHGQTPYVWKFSKDGTQIKKKSPKKLFYQKDMYTIFTEDGERDLRLEMSLSRVESRFSRIRSEKLEKHLPLTSEEQLILCMFTAAMFSRTKSFEKHQSGQWSSVLDWMNRVNAAFNDASPEELKKMIRALQTPVNNENENISIEDIRDLVDNPVQNLLSVNVMECAPLLFKRPNIILEANGSSSFITSDNPCVWYDTSIYQRPRPFGAGGLISPTLEITLPLSPNQMLFFGSQLKLTGVYMFIEDVEIIDNLNKRTRIFADQFCVTNCSSIRAEWM